MYRVTTGERSQAQIDALPPEALAPFAEARAVLEIAPWGGALPRQHRQARLRHMPVEERHRCRYPVCLHGFAIERGAVGGGADPDDGGMDDRIVGDGGGLGGEDRRADKLSGFVGAPGG